ncbi:MAG: PolC-type DNA polymerase III [Collinsella sp.]
MLIEDAVSSGTPQFVIDSYATLAERAKTQSFGLIEEDVIVLDAETTGLSVQDNELIEISAARLSGREVVDRFDTFVHPKQLIPAEITELTSITMPMWQMPRRPLRPVPLSPILSVVAR